MLCRLWRAESLGRVCKGGGRVGGGGCYKALSLHVQAKISALQMWGRVGGGEAWMFRPTSWPSAVGTQKR